MKVITGKLFSGHEVEIDSRCLELGGSWERNLENDKAVAYDRQAISFVADRVGKKPNSLLVDIGANTGSFCLIAKFLNCKAIAIEPQLKVAAILDNNIKLNKLEKHVSVINCALGENSGSLVELNVPVENSGLATVGELMNSNSIQTETIRQFSLDHLIQQQDVSTVSFIKIDTEGNELPILKGAVSTISKYLPEMLIEFSKSYQVGYSPYELVKYIRKLKYKVLILNGEDFFCITNKKSFEGVSKFQLLINQFKLFRLLLSHYLHKKNLEVSKR